MFQQDEVAVLYVGDEIARDNVRAFGWEQHGDNENDDDRQVVADDRLEWPAVMNVVVVQLDKTSRILHTQSDLLRSTRPVPGIGLCWHGTKPDKFLMGKNYRVSLAICYLPPDTREHTPP